MNLNLYIDNKLYITISIFCILIPLITNIPYKYLFYINILSTLLIVNGFININKYIFLLILLFLLFRFIFLDKNKSKNKKGVVENFDNDDIIDDDMEETGIEEFLIKDKFSQLHEVIHEYQNAIQREKLKTEKKQK